MPADDMPEDDMPHDGTATGTSVEVSRARTRRRSKFRRRMTSGAGLMVGLVLAGTLYSAFTPAQAATDASTDSAAVAAGQALYERSCITCHGSNLQGVPERGPSLIGVGEAAVYFQVHTGRMPLVRQGPQATDKPPVLSQQEIDQ